MNLQAFYDSTALSNKGVLLDAEKASNDGDTLLLSQKLNLVAPSDIVEYNYKLFYNLCLNVKNASFSNTDSLELFYLASACPDVDGSVVYQARALYNAIYACAETFESNCLTNTAKSMKANTENSEEIELISVYPNPNNGEFLITGSFNEGYIIKITTMDGKITYSDKLKESTNFISIKSNLKSGSYFVFILSKTDDEIYQGKITIIN